MQVNQTLVPWARMPCGNAADAGFEAVREGSSGVGVAVPVGVPDETDPLSDSTSRSRSTMPSRLKSPKPPSLALRVAAAGTRRWWRAFLQIVGPFLDAAQGEIFRNPLCPVYV